MKVLRYIITNVPLDKEKEMLEALASLVKSGVIKTNDVHYRIEEISL